MSQKCDDVSINFDTVPALADGRTDGQAELVKQYRVLHVTVCMLTCDKKKLRSAGCFSNNRNYNYCVIRTGGQGYICDITLTAAHDLQCLTVATAPATNRLYSAALVPPGAHGIALAYRLSVETVNTFIFGLLLLVLLQYKSASPGRIAMHLYQYYCTVMSSSGVDL